MPRGRRKITEDDVNCRVNIFADAVVSAVISETEKMLGRPISKRMRKAMEAKKKRWREEARIFLLDYFDIVP